MSGGLILDLFGFPMSSPIPHRIAPVLPARPPVTAGTHEAKSVTPHNVAREYIIPKPGLHPDDGDRVEHGANVTPRLGDEHGCEFSYSRSARSAGSEAAEAQRLGRLARWHKC